ncbi:hypothetical protein [Marinobacter similis]|uniref:Uncharacterized protein n=1 Tax=Marinobacter similis TaxID=1420916 RepID=W5YMM8_9GAMM|nr:hypothetical protein [Marinobacter similis]AHI30174.1 hypothetical protein AU14_14140 [Marinobacter similis]
MNVIGVLGVVLAGVLVFMAGGMAHAQESRSMLDGDVLAAEAGQVELVTNASGEVVQVRVANCERCAQESYLPSRNLRVSQSGRPDAPESPNSFNGQAGTVVVNLQSGMVEQIIFWALPNRGNDQ